MSSSNNGLRQTGQRRVSLNGAMSKSISDAVRSTSRSTLVSSTTFNVLVTGSAQLFRPVSTLALCSGIVLSTIAMVVFGRLLFRGV